MSRRPSLAERLDALDAVAELGGGHLDAEVVGRVGALAERAGARRAIGFEHAVVALAGSTGSGKSSLFNVLAGADLSPVEVRRPTTTTAHACVWGHAPAEPLLDWLGVPALAGPATRHRPAHDDAHLQGLVLLDLPDHDSVRPEHRAEVERLLDVVDLFVWVVDPQKYADAALHERYLRDLAPYDGLTLVVLNQVDRLDEAGAQACLADLRGLLDAEGLGQASVLATSACTGRGLDDLYDELARSLARRSAATARLSVDVDRLAADLLEAVGPARPAVRVPREQAHQLTEALAEAAGVPALVDASARATRERAIAATGWPLTRWVRRVRHRRRDPLRQLGLPRTRRAASGYTALPVPTPVAVAQVDSAVRALAGHVAGDLPAGWQVSVGRVAGEHQGELVAAVDAAVAAVDLGVSVRPWWVRALAPLQWVLAAATVVGLGWLVAAAVVDWLDRPRLPTYPAGRVPLPALLAAVGIGLGLLVAGLGRGLADLAARRTARRADQRLRDAVAAAAGQHLIDPVAAEAGTHARLADAVTRAAGT